MVRRSENSEGAPTCDDGQDGAEQRCFLESHLVSHACLVSILGDGRVSRIPLACLVQLVRSPRPRRRIISRPTGPNIRPIHWADLLPWHCRGYAAVVAALLGSWPAPPEEPFSAHWLTTFYRRGATARRSEWTDEKSCLSYQTRHAAAWDSRLARGRSYLRASPLVSLSNRDGSAPDLSSPGVAESDWTNCTNITPTIIFQLELSNGMLNFCTIVFTQTRNAIVDCNTLICIEYWERRLYRNSICISTSA